MEASEGDSSQLIVGASVGNQRRLIVALYGGTLLE